MRQPLVRSELGSERSFTDVPKIGRGRKVELNAPMGRAPFWHLKTWIKVFDSEGGLDGNGKMVLVRPRKGVAESREGILRDTEHVHDQEIEYQKIPIHSEVVAKGVTMVVAGEKVGRTRHSARSNNGQQFVT